MIPVSLPEPSGTRPHIFSYLALAICALAVVYIAERIRFWSVYWQSDARFVALAEPLDLTVGTAAFQIPQGYIVSGHWNFLQKDNRTDHLRLAMTWPGLAPAGHLSANSSQQQLRVELEHNPGRESLRAHLDPFYRRLARGGELRGPDGLKILTLSARGSARTDLVVYDPSRQDGFIARCRQETSRAVPTCHRAVLLASGLDLRYQFDQTLLPDWRQLDPAVLQKTGSFLVQ